MTASDLSTQRQVSSRPTGVPPPTPPMTSPPLPTPHHTSRPLALSLVRHLVASSLLTSTALAQSQPLPLSTTAQQLSCQQQLAGALVFPNAGSSHFAFPWSIGHFCVVVAVGRSMAKPSLNSAGVVTNPSLLALTPTLLVTPGCLIAHHSTQPLPMPLNGSSSHSSKHLMNPSPLSTSQPQVTPTALLTSSPTSNPVMTTTAGSRSAWRFTP